MKKTTAFLLAAMLSAGASASDSPITDPSFENGKTKYKVTRMENIFTAVKEGKPDERFIFNRDHTTVLASIDVVSNEITSNPETERVVAGLIKEFS